MMSDTRFFSSEVLYQDYKEREIARLEEEFKEIKELQKKM